jgi:lysophospholipase L1-like esterase
MSALEAAGTVDGSEVVGIRTGADGTEYETAGDAVREQYANAKHDVDRVDGLVRKNLITSIVTGKYYSIDGGFGENANASYCQPIFLRATESVYVGWASLFGINDKMVRVTQTGDALEYYDYTDLDSSAGWVKYTAPKDGYYAFNLSYKNHTVTFDIENITDNRVGVFLPEVLNPDVILKYQPQEITRPNMVRELIAGHYSSKTFVSDGQYFHTNPIRLSFGDRVYVTNKRQVFGGNARAYRYNGDLTEIAELHEFTETTDEYQVLDVLVDGYYTFNTDGFICVCLSPDDIEKPIGAYLPADVIYPDLAVFGNPLTGKTVVFDGDSICHGTSVGSEDSTYGYGWAGRIGVANGMTWANEGKSGGVIARGMTGRHCLCDNIDHIHSNTPMLDYLILEGGTNDADLLGEDGLGVYDESDYGGTYDTTTFSGALETLFYKAINYYPAAKIGYIVAHKMLSNTSRRAFFDRAVEICEKWGIPYLDLWHGAPLNNKLAAHWDKSLDAQGNIDAGKMYTDGQHLTAVGYDAITPKIEAWMKTL